MKNLMIKLEYNLNKDKWQLNLLKKKVFHLTI